MFQIDQLKRKLSQNGYVVGTHVKWPGSNIVETYAMAGYDYIWIDGEHSTLSLEMVNSHIRTAQAWGSAAFYRVAWNDPILVKPILELGPDGIVFPMITTRDAAQAAVKSMKYPPDGIRGYAPGRSIRYGHTPLNNYLEETKKIWTILQLEHIDAVSNLDDILSVEGADAYVIGMMDLSASIGKLGQLRSPELLSLLEKICAKLRKTGKPFGVSMGYNEEIVKEWINRGATLISVSGEEEMLCIQGERTLAEMHRLFAGKEASQ